MDFYDVEHLQSMDDTVDDMLIIYRQNGGTLAWYWFFMTQPNHHQIATYLTDYALSELVRYVMEDTGCSLEQAMERVYNSSFMPALQDEENELYIQSPAYLYEMMNLQQ